MLRKAILGGLAALVVGGASALVVWACAGSPVISCATSVALSTSSPCVTVHPGTGQPIEIQGKILMKWRCHSHHWAAKPLVDFFGLEKFVSHWADPELWVSWDSADAKRAGHVAPHSLNQVAMVAWEA